MPVVRDFRLYSFRPARIDRCGRNIGSKAYWKLYVIENTIRIVIHSILSVNVNPNWWTDAVDKTIRDDAQRFRKRYQGRPQNASPGAHDIHLTFLSHLSKILLANRHLFVRVVPDIDQWIATLEGILMPRNLVGHMNFPNSFDRNAIDMAYAKLPSLLNHLVTNRVPIQIPN
jgi:hypothetical protein